MELNMSKILLVEDDKSLREIYGVRLSAEGYEIVAAGDGEEALAIAVKERPDLIISDVMMPKISGFDMLDILRATPETKDLKVIMMTALSSEDQRQRGESLGANRYLVKSQVGIEDVVRAVHEVLLDTPGAQQEANNDFSNVQPPVERSEDSVPLGVAASQADIEAALAAAPPIPEDPVPIIAPAPAPEAVAPAPETPAPVVATAEASAQTPAPVAPVAPVQEVAPAPAEAVAPTVVAAGESNISTVVPVAQAQEATAQPALNPEPSHSTLPDEQPVVAPAVNQAEQPVAPAVSTLPPEANAIPQPQPQPQPQTGPQPQPVATPAPVAPVAPVEVVAPVVEAPAPVVPPVEAAEPQPRESMQLPTPTAPFSTPAPDSLRSQALPTDLPSQQEQSAPAPSLEVAAPAPAPVTPVESTAPVAEAPVAPAATEPIPAPAPAVEEPVNPVAQFQHEALIQPPEASAENSNGYERPEQAPLAGKAPDIKPFTPPQPLDHTNDPDYSKMLDEELNDGPPAFPPSPEA